MVRPFWIGCYHKGPNQMEKVQIKFSRNSWFLWRGNFLPAYSLTEKCQDDTNQCHFDKSVIQLLSRFPLSKRFVWNSNWFCHRPYLHKCMHPSTQPYLEHLKNIPWFVMLPWYVKSMNINAFCTVIVLYILDYPSPTWTGTHCQ